MIMSNAKEIKNSYYVLPDWILGKTVGESLALESHLDKVGETMRFLLTESMYSNLLNLIAESLKITEEEALSLCIYLAKMHDIGKVHALFQRKLADALGTSIPKEYDDARVILQPYRHEIGSAEIAQRIWKRDKLFNRRCRKAFSQILKLHHQGKAGRNYSCSPEWERLQDTLEEKLRSENTLPIIPDLDDYGLDAVCTLITGLIILCDWIASGNGERPAFASLKQKELGPKRTFEGMFGYPPRQVQRKIIERFEDMDILPLLLIIEAPMGEGKTELALYLADMLSRYWGQNGLYVGMPTTATANQMVDRVREIYGETDLVHSTAWLRSENKTLFESEFEPSEVKSWESPRKRGCLARYAVGTVDQVMRIGLLVRYGVIRLVGMTNKVVIIDELHAYDAYMQRIIERVLDWCLVLKIPVIMLSATLPAETKKRMLGIEPVVSYPLVTSIFDDGTSAQFALSCDDVWKKSSVNLKFANCFPSEFDEGCTTVIANTVKSAQKIYASSENCEKILFHSKFTNARRAEIEKIVLQKLGKTNRPKKYVVIATQVAEQSLDMDADHLITENAPIDIIFQRIGRYHRWNIPRASDDNSVTIVKDNPKSKYVYYPILLQKTWEILQNRSQLHIPDDIPELVNAVYSGEPDAKQLEDFFKMQCDIALKTSEAEAALFPEPKSEGFGLAYQMTSVMPDDNESWNAHATRLGAESTRLCIIPERLYSKLKIAENKASADSDTAKEIFLYSIPVRMTDELLKEVQGCGLLEGCTILKAFKGDDPTGDLETEKYIVSRELGLIERRNNV